MVSSAIVVAMVGGPGAPPVSEMDGGNQRPVPLMPALNRPLIAHAFEDLDRLGVQQAVVIVDREIMVAVSSVLEQAAAGGMSVEIIRRDSRTPLIRAIARARDMLEPGPFLLRFADCLSGGDLESLLDPGPAFGPYDAVVLTSRFSGFPTASSGNGNGADLRHRDQRRTQGAAFHAGMFMLGSGFSRAPVDPKERRLATIIDAALAQSQRSGGRIQRRYASDWWRYRGQEEAILEINRFLLDGLKDLDCAAEMIDSDIEGPVACDPGTRIESSVIRGPVAIGPGAEINHAFLGPFTTVGPDVKIEGAELENSVVLEGSLISHVGVRLDSSVIGPRSRIYRDFKMPRRTRLFVGPGSNIALQ